ncbi:MAG: peptidylprolyl isomerase, partial [Beijerinckiaceae bacterium]
MATSNETTACAVKPAVSAKPKTVSVNSVSIARDAIARETQNHPAAKPIDAWQAAARALVIRELLLQEAARLGISADPA